jgi:hypothetical protein
MEEVMETYDVPAWNLSFSILNHQLDLVFQSGNIECTFFRD